MDNNKINLKKIIITIIIFSFLGCYEVGYISRINSEIAIKIPSPCGNITLKAVYFRGQINLGHTSDSKNEGLILNLDSISMNIDIDRTTTYRNNKGKNLININNGKEVSVTIYPNVKLKDGEQIKILPCGYLKCNGTNVIKDTILIQVRTK